MKREMAKAGGKTEKEERWIDRWLNKYAYPLPREKQPGREESIKDKEIEWEGAEELPVCVLK